MVKSFNTMNFKALGSEGRPGAPRAERLAIYLAGDDAAAKDVVAGLIDEVGFAPVDMGSLHEGGARQQPGSPIYNNPMRPSPQSRRCAEDLEHDRLRLDRGVADREARPHRVLVGRPA